MRLSLRNIAVALWRVQPGAGKARGSDAYGSHRLSVCYLATWIGLRSMLTCVSAHRLRPGPQDKDADMKGAASAAVANHPSQFIC